MSAVAAWDVPPSRDHASLLRRWQDGGQIVVTRSGRGFELERAGTPVSHHTVKKLLNRQWVSDPCRNGPLFGADGDGRLTPRGAKALAAYLKDRDHA